jgi:hypothetical protein
VVHSIAKSAAHAMMAPQRLPMGSIYSVSA